MPDRHFGASAVVLAASIALIPGLAYAADPSQAATATRPAEAAALVKAESSQFKTFTGSAHASVQRTTAGAIPSDDSDPWLGLTLTAQQSSAYSVWLSSQVTSAAGLELTASINWGDGTVSSISRSSTGALGTSHTYAKLGAYTITVTLSDGLGNNAVDTVALTTAGSDYTPYGPTRLLDTRYGTGAPTAKVRNGTAAKVQIAGNQGIPADVTAVVLNVTVTNATSGGYITAYGDGEARPSTSNLNFTAHSTVANQVIVTTGADGAVDLYNGSPGSVDLIADIAGYFTLSPSSGYTPLTPDRLVDTRYGTGTTKHQLAGGSSLVAQVADADSGKLPASGITALAVNITATGSKGAGYLTAYPDGAKTPVASNVNYGAKQTVANAVITPVGADGKIRIYNGGGQPISVIVDVVGYYSATSKSAYVPYSPFRAVDTRSADGKTGPLPANGYTDLPLSPGNPQYTAFVLNATVTDTTGQGYLTVGPDSNTWTQYENHTAKRPAKPAGSTLNWLPTQTVANLLQANVGTNGIIDFWDTGNGTAALIFDEFGAYEDK